VTQPLVVDVVFSSPFDPNQPYHDLKEIIAVQKPERTTWYWYLIGLALLLLFTLLLFPKRKKKELKQIPVDAYTNAMSQLDQLARAGLASTNSNTYFVELINIFREYLHRRRNIQSFYQTTDDLGLQIQQLQLPAELNNQLLQTLRLSDLVKFAKYQPYDEEQKQSFNVIRKSIVEIENIQ
jgi:LPXTG-motif cell wall-anchored protein